MLPFCNPLWFWYEKQARIKKKENKNVRAGHAKFCNPYWSSYEGIARRKKKTKNKYSNIRGIPRVLLGLATRKKSESTRKNENVLGITRVLRSRNSAVVVYPRRWSPGDKKTKKKNRKVRGIPRVLKYFMVFLGGRNLISKKREEKSAQNTAGIVRKNKTRWISRNTGVSGRSVVACCRLLRRR